jgi:hypothetical protein
MQTTQKKHIEGVGRIRFYLRGFSSEAAAKTKTSDPTMAKRRDLLQKPSDTIVFSSITYRNRQTGKQNPSGKLTHSSGSDVFKIAVLYTPWRSIVAGKRRG